jgi:hypothetical protein
MVRTDYRVWPNGPPVPPHAARVLGEDGADR